MATRTTTEQRLRLSSQFNERIQFDLLFFEEFIIVHLLDEATRWTMAVYVPDKRLGTIVKSITLNWFQTYGAPVAIVCDGEGALQGDEALQWLDRWDTARIPRAP